MPNVRQFTPLGVGRGGQPPIPFVNGEDCAAARRRRRAAEKLAKRRIAPLDGPALSSRAVALRPQNDSRVSPPPGSPSGIARLARGGRTRSLCFPEPPPYRGSRGMTIIGRKSLLHRSLKRWFTRSVHSTGGCGAGPGPSILPVRSTERAVGRSPLDVLNAPESRSEGKPQPFSIGSLLLLRA
jgi:hypothetical protein